MSDVGELYRAWGEDKKRKKESNQEYSTNLLIQKGVEFESKNWGNHLVVTGKNCVIDFWPSTGKFIVRGVKHGRGVRNLLKLCEVKS